MIEKLVTVLLSPIILGFYMIHYWPIALAVYYSVFGFQQVLAHRRVVLTRRFRIMRWILGFLPPAAVIIVLGWSAALPSGVEPLTQSFAPIFTLPVALLAAIILFFLTFKELNNTEQNAAHIFQKPRAVSENGER